LPQLRHGPFELDEALDSPGWVETNGGIQQRLKPIDPSLELAF
jgi:hypothetical protein